MMDFRVTAVVTKRPAQGTCVALQLKVCEGCGALWLRAAEQGVYCRKCADWLVEMPVLRPEGRRGRRRKRRGTGLALVSTRGGAR